MNWLTDWQVSATIASPTGFKAVENVEVGGISSEIEGGRDAGTPLDLARNPSNLGGVSHSELVGDHRAELAQALVRALGRTCAERPWAASVSPSTAAG